jgi:4'-phosphopantetheinyl transferase
MDDAIVEVRDSDGRAADRGLLAEVAARLLGVAPADVAVEQNCAHCGGTDHGQPAATGPGRVFLSLSRAGGRVAVAASLTAPVGVDIESPDRVAAAGFDDVAFTQRERAGLRAGPRGADDRARLWAAKEALLKAEGRGLRRDPREIEVLVGVGGELAAAAASIRLFDAGPGLVGVVAQLSSGTEAL